jgi:hypothetical protein
LNGDVDFGDSGELNIIEEKRDKIKIEKEIHHMIKKNKEF